jgi:DNA repair exonuclease SbcCD ATPase subunit
MKPNLLRLAVLVPAVAAFCTAPVCVRASEASARAEANLAEVKGDAAKAALDELNAEIDRVDAMLDNAPTPEEHDAAKARLDVLKERRNDLRKTYVRARYDQLKADVRAEANRVSAWTKKTFNRDEVSNARREMNDAADDAKRAAARAGDSAYATAHSTAAAMDLAAYKLRPTDTNKEEAKAALKALDAKIEELDERADAMPAGPDRDAAQRHVQALEDRKDELKHEFNKARFDALVDDVQREWNELIH